MTVQIRKSASPWLLTSKGWMFYLGSPEAISRQVAALTGMCSYSCPEQGGDKLTWLFFPYLEFFSDGVE